MNADADVVVVGAGPAGSSAAIHARRLGYSVVLLEREKFPRRKVCGGCLSADGVARATDLLGGRAPPGLPERAVTWVTRSGRCLRHRSSGHGRITLRTELDTLLLQKARACGVCVYEGVTANPRRAADVWVVQTSLGDIHARVVLLASGLAGARFLGARSDLHRPQRAPQMLGWQWVQTRSHAGPEPGEVEMHWLDGGYAGLACPNDNECNVAIALDRRAYRMPGPPTGTSVKRALDRLRAANPKALLWSRLQLDEKTSLATTAKSVAGFPAQPARLGNANLLLIGDAAGYGEPFVGDGMTLAMLSGELAARAFHDLQGGSTSSSIGTRESRLVRRYSELMQQFHRPLMRRTRALARVLRQPWLDFLDARLPRWWPTSPFVWLIGRMHARGGA